MNQYSNISMANMSFTGASKRTTLFGVDKMNSSSNLLWKAALGFFPLFVNLHKRIENTGDNGNGPNNDEIEESELEMVVDEEEFKTDATTTPKSRLILHFHSTDDNDEEGYVPDLEEISECSMGSGWTTANDDQSSISLHQHAVIGKRKTQKSIGCSRNNINDGDVDTVFADVDDNIGRDFTARTRSNVSELTIASTIASQSSDWDTASMQTANQSLQDSGYLPSGSASISSSDSTYAGSFFNFARTPSVNLKRSRRRRRQKQSKRRERDSNDQNKGASCSYSVKACGVIVETEPSEDIVLGSSMSI
mmetsp:Transcript_2661/g.4551  ORF Transcript_2661/g.4551 Transcript_2661/m.4551 type:complete len:307 (-) Transcript_2661:1288-2208(-)